MDASRIVALFEALNSEGVRYKVVGAVALNMLGLPRATVDIDLFVAPTEANVASLRRALHAVFDDPSIDELSAEDLRGDFPVVQYVPPDGTFHVDIISRLGDAFGFDDIETETREIEGVVIEVATAEMLYRMKKDTVRPQDRADAARLRERFGFAEEE